MIRPYCKHSGFLSKRKLSLNWARDLPTNNQNTIPTDRLGAKCRISTIATTAQMADLVAAR